MYKLRASIISDIVGWEQIERMGGCFRFWCKNITCIKSVKNLLGGETVVLLTLKMLLSRKHIKGYTYVYSMGTFWH